MDADEAQAVPRRNRNDLRLDIPEPELGAFTPQHVIKLCVGVCSKGSVPFERSVDGGNAR